MHLIHVHTGADGRSHFADLDLALTGDPAGASIELLAAVQGVAFRELAPGWSRVNHTTPRRQIVVQLSGTGEVTCGDGTSQLLGPGDLLLADDIVGEGHTSREIEGPRQQAVIYLDPALDLRSITQGVR